MSLFHEKWLQAWSFAFYVLRIWIINFAELVLYCELPLLGVIVLALFDIISSWIMQQNII
jgi:hypothetical protein